MRSSPIPFTPTLTTLLALTTYIIITVLLLVIHFVPPRNIPSQASQDEARISVVDAWHDLQHITGDWGFHPYNSHANDKVKEYLVRRINQILEANKVGIGSHDGDWNGNGVKVQIVDDVQSNVTFAAESSGVSVYYEGTNLIVIVEGTENAGKSEDDKERLGAVLVNSHYDSVSTGYGATDDGTAVVTLLQLISYFTNPNTPLEDRPHRDVIFLFNNGEEDYLVCVKAPHTHMSD